MSYQEIHGKKEIFFNNMNRFIDTLIKNPNKIGLIYTSHYQRARYITNQIFEDLLSNILIDIKPELYINNLEILLNNGSRIKSFCQSQNNYLLLQGYKIDYILMDIIPDNLFMEEIYYNINRSD